MSTQHDDMLRALRDAYTVLAFAFQRIHALPRSRDTELAADIGRVRARIQAVIAEAEAEATAEAANPKNLLVYEDGMPG